MPRHARVTCAGLPHHVTHRGNRRGRVFYARSDYLIYLHWLREYARRWDVAILAYCLMTNHVHLVLVPQARGGLGRLFKALHARIAQRINRKNAWSGHLWQQRFFSSVLDESYFWAALRYVELNPVRAGMVRRAEDYPWSSAASHCGLARDPILTEPHCWTPQFSAIESWSAWLAEGLDQRPQEILRKHAMRNLPCGSDDFVAKLEHESGRSLRFRRRGRPARDAGKGERPLFCSAKKVNVPF